MRIRSRSHLDFLKTLPCSIRFKGDHVCEGPIDPAHHRGSKDGGMGLKPGDNHALPLCRSAHDEQHRIGEPAFEKRYGISMAEHAAMCWAISEKKIDPIARKRAKAKAKGPKKRIANRGFDKTKTVKLRTREVVERKPRRAA